jgi:hypothetical protein
MIGRLVAMAAVLACAGSGPAAAQDIAVLAWLSGDWEEVKPEGPHVASWTLEHWTRPRGGVMLGTNLSGRRTGNSFSADVGEVARGFEYMRIARGSDGVLAFHASPNGAPASAFPAIRAEPGMVVFENSAHDYPQRIVYRREGDALVATISLIDGSNPMSWNFRLVRPR